MKALIKIVVNLVYSNANLIQVQATSGDGTVVTALEVVYGYEILSWLETVTGAQNHVTSDCWYAQHFPHDHFYRSNLYRDIQWDAPAAEELEYGYQYAYTLAQDILPNCSSCDGTPYDNAYTHTTDPYDIAMTGFGWLQSDWHTHGVHLSDGTHGPLGGFDVDHEFHACLTDIDCSCVSDYCVGQSTADCCVPEASEHTLERDEWSNTLTFIKHWPRNEEQTVLLHFNEMAYWLPPDSWDGTGGGERSDPDQITFWKEPGVVHSLSPWGYTNVAFLVKIQTNTRYTIKPNDFTYPTLTRTFHHTEQQGMTTVDYETFYPTHMLDFYGIENDEPQVRAIDFTGSSNVTLSKGTNYADNGSSTINYAEFQWSGNGPPPFPNQAGNEPVCYVGGTKPKMNITIFAKGMTETNEGVLQLKLKDALGAAGSDALMMTKNITVKGQSTVLSNLEWDVVLTNGIGGYTYNLTWQLAMKRKGKLGKYHDLPVTQHNFLITHATPQTNENNTATVQRMKYAVTAAQGTATEDAAAKKAFNRLSTDVSFNLNRNDTDNPWSILTNKFLGSDCISLATLMKYSLNLAGVNATTTNLYAKTKNTDVFTEDTTNLVVNGEAQDCTLKFYSGGGTNNYEAVCVAANRYYAPTYLHCDNPLNLLLFFVCQNNPTNSPIQYQTWRYVDQFGGQFFVTNAIPVALPTGVSCPAGIPVLGAPSGCTRYTGLP